MKSNIASYRAFVRALVCAITTDDEYVAADFTHAAHTHSRRLTYEQQEQGKQDALEIVGITDALRGAGHE